MNNGNNESIVSRMFGGVVVWPPESGTFDLHAESIEPDGYVQAFNLEAESAGAPFASDRDVSRLLQIANSAMDLIGGIASGRDAERLMPVVASARLSLDQVAEQFRGASGAAQASERGDEAVCLADCLAEMTPLLHLMCRADIRLSIQACPYLPHALCDVVALEAAIMSLVLNARNALPGGGVISIVATTRSDRLDGAGVVLVVASSPLEREGGRAGRKPRMAPPSPATTVLNLATASHFAASIGGCLVVESERGGKAIIALHLPVTGNGPRGQERIPLHTAHGGLERPNRNI